MRPFGVLACLVVALAAWQAEAAPPALDGGHWQLVWHDEFDESQREICLDGRGPVGNRTRAGGTDLCFFVQAS
jgi:hypothetical protein